MKCPKTSLKVQCAKCQGFGHSFVNSTSKPLVIQEYKDIDGKKKTIMFNCMNSILRTLVA